jgi:hypothetical protein
MLSAGRAAAFSRRFAPRVGAATTISGGGSKQAPVSSSSYGSVIRYFSTGKDGVVKEHRILAANRGEIATRIMRASTELGMKTVGIYSNEDRFTQHRYKADQAFQLEMDKSPVGAYLDIEGITAICVENNVTAVHPGYGFLSENEAFARSLEANGIIFIGPTVENLGTFGDKTVCACQNFLSLSSTYKTIL